MKSDIKKQWVAELRSGDYKQGRTQLANTDTNTFCCLGVLCELSGLPYNPNHELPDFTVRAWAGLDEIALPLVKYQGVMREITYINDCLGLTFIQIADLIEAQL